MNQINTRIAVGDKGDISAVIHVPDGFPSQGGNSVIIAHGANNDMNNPFIVSIADGLAHAGYLAMRFNFLYRERGKVSPDSPANLFLAWESAYRFLISQSGFSPSGVVAAGKSMGGRVASQLVSEGRVSPDALIFFGYPLHAPGRHDRLKDSHLYKIEKPMMFISGSKDPLCKLELLEKVLERISPAPSLNVIQGGDHSFRVPKSDSRSHDEIYSEIIKIAAEWLDTI